MTDGEKRKALHALGKSLVDWQPRGGVTSFSAYRQYILSERRTFPFSGGWLEQPIWVRDDFELFDDVMNYHMLNDEV